MSTDERVTIYEGYVSIKLYNKYKEHIDDTIISAEDYPIVSKYKLYKSKEYVSLKVNGRETKLHKLLMPNDDDNMVVDHIDGNTLNNKRDNLRIVTRIINAHNRKKKNNSLSKFIGICTYRDKWRSYIRHNSKQISIGIFDSEEEAARQYDIVAYQIHKENANTNNLLSDEEIQIAIKSEYEEKKSALPKNISKYKDQNYRVKLRYNNKTFLAYKKTLEEAIQTLNKFLKEKEEFEQKCKMNMDIIYHNSIPVIVIKKDYNIHLSYVDENIWHEINSKKWYIHNGYAVSQINGKMHSMHAYIYMLVHNELSTVKQPIDHINNNKLDNRVDNLRKVSASVNGHNCNKQSSTTSKYTGVYLNKKGKWNAYISKDYKQYHIGIFQTENAAALAYNIKATELYSNFARLNTIE